MRARLPQLISRRRRPSQPARATRFSAALLCALAIATPAQAEWQANDDDALLFDLRSGKYRLGDGVRGYQTDTGVCVDLADTIMALDVPVRLDKKSRRATGWLFAESQRLVIDRAGAGGGRVQTMNTDRALRSGEVRDTPEGWCVATESLGQWLNVDLTPDLSNALLLLESDRKLPFQSAIDRKERAARIRPSAAFDLTDLPQSREPYRLWRTPSVDVVVSAGGVRSRRQGQSMDLRYELFASGEIGKASVDARLSSDNRGVPDSLRVRAFRTDPEGRLLGPLKATHVAAGDIATVTTPIVSQSTVGRGAFVTNRPVNRPDSFDTTDFRGELPAGWDAELYRNGELLAFATSRGDGRYEFLEVDLLYGDNRFEVVLYGPQGQEQRSFRSVPVGLASIPPEQTFYWAAVQQTNTDLIGIGRRRDRFSGFGTTGVRGWRGGFGLERGLDARTSVAGALHSLRIDGDRRHYAELSLRRAIGPALVELTGAGDQRGDAAFQAQLLGRLGDSTVRAEGFLRTGDFRAGRFGQNVNAAVELGIDHRFAIGSRIVPFSIEAQYDQLDGGNDLTRLRARASWNTRRVAVTGALSYERPSSNFGPDPPDRAEAALLVSGRVGKLRLRGEAAFRITPDAALEQVNLTGEWRAGERSDWRGELGYDAALGRVRGGIGLTRRFDRFALTGSIEAASDGSVAAGLNLAFSFGPDPRGGGFRVTREKLASSGQAVATVFRDTNRDGRRQADEPLVEGVELTAGQGVANAPTDANGQGIVDALEPFRPILIGIDASSLSDPYTQPALPGVVVTPRPGIAARVELPLVSAGEVEGTLVGPSGNPLAGVELELRDAAGRVRARTITEFDGFFLFQSVVYGDYTLDIKPESAAAVAVASRLGVTATVDDANQIARLGAVRAREAAPTLASAGP